MEIIKSSAGLSKKAIYRLTNSQSAISLKNLSESIQVKVSVYVYYSDVNSKGDDIELLTISCEDGTIYGTNSKTFIEAFNKIINDLGDPDPDSGEDGWVGELMIIKDISKNNRTFFTCDMIN